MVEIALCFVHAGSVPLFFVLAILAGVGVSVGYLVPLSMSLDVIEQTPGGPLPVQPVRSITSSSRQLEPCPGHAVGERERQLLIRVVCQSLLCYNPATQTIEHSVIWEGKTVRD